MLGIRFKPLAFREVCADQADDFDGVGLATTLRSSLDEAARQTIIACLKAVAAADGEVAACEQALIDSFEKALGVGASAEHQG